MKFYCEEAGRALAELKSTPDGLTDAEAARRLAEKGPNKLAEGKKVTTLQRFLQQLSDPMIIILLVAAAVSGVTAAYSGESFADVFIILIVVLINAVLGVYQESKAEKAIEALQEMTAATSKVIRGGKQVSLKSEELVPGDVVVLEAGDAVPADGRILESASLKIEEAALTGESVPVNKVVSALGLDDGKDVPLGDRKNMAYMGSTVVYGRGRVLITGTGMDTEMGKIAGALAQAEEGQTPLQKKLAQLSKILSWLVLGICVFIFAFSLIKAGDFHLDVIISTFMVAVSLAVAAIPEGLATVVTIVLSIGVTNMSKRNAVIRRLTAVETLGCAQVICSDKTGTLTQNKMTVVEHVGEEEPLARAMSLCSDAKPGENGDAEGEPTECALVNYATGVGLPKGTLEAAQPRVGEAPFDSGRKMMSTVHENNGAYIQYTKGAPDVVLSRCTSYAKDGKILPMTEEARAEILRQNKQMADKALRVLCAASREWPQLPPDFEPDTLEHDLTFLGLTGMIDPIRPEVKDAITECRQAGIRPIMITGDHKDTAIAIAKQLGIIETADEAITGAELNDISDDRFAEVIGRYSVYARVQPEHKVRIVNAWRKNGFVTAMTGDGVNDAPSIKSADIGIGMGITGTDVTKNVADMVLADDNFATIVNAVDSELGVVQPVAEIAALLKDYPHCHLHVDATQAVGKLPLPSFEGIDTLSLTAHKFYGLNGIGVLVKRRGLALEPLIHGGESTTIYRSGTPTVALACSLALALDKAMTELPERVERVRSLNARLRTELANYPKVRINSPEAAVPQILNLSVKDVKGTVFQRELDAHGVCVSVKSACSSDGLPSRAVFAVSRDRRNALSSWRISLSHRTTDEEITGFLQAFDACYRTLTQP